MGAHGGVDRPARRRLSYANVTATLALFFAMSGGALAAKHYLISSTKQIKPSVLKALKGKAGPAGTPGAAGTAGGQGPQGATGATGPGVETFAYNDVNTSSTLTAYTQMTEIDGMTFYGACQGGSTMSTDFAYSGTGEAIGIEQGNTNVQTEALSSTSPANFQGVNETSGNVLNAESSWTFETSAGQFQLTWDGESNYSNASAPTCHIELSILPLG
jgi:hypothetical protein